MAVAYREKQRRRTESCAVRNVAMRYVGRNVKKFLLMVPDGSLRSKLEGGMMRWNYFSTYNETLKKVRSLDCLIGGLIDLIVEVISTYSYQFVERSYTTACLPSLRYQSVRSSSIFKSFSCVDTGVLFILRAYILVLALCSDRNTCIFFPILL